MSARPSEHYGEVKKILTPPIKVLTMYPPKGNHHRHGTARNWLRRQNRETDTSIYSCCRWAVCCRNNNQQFSRKRRRSRPKPRTFQEPEKSRSRSLGKKTKS